VSTLGDSITAHAPTNRRHFDAEGIPAHSFVGMPFLGIREHHRNPAPAVPTTISSLVPSWATRKHSLQPTPANLDRVTSHVVIYPLLNYLRKISEPSSAKNPRHHWEIELPIYLTI
jgi:hypothetical protein